MQRLYWLALGALLVLPPAATAQVSRTIEVAGVVVDEDTGEPLAGVAVSIHGTEIGALTDAEGRYHLRNVPNQNSAITAQRLGYIPEMRAFWVCTPITFPDGRCQPASARDQWVRFYMRGTPPPVRP